MGGQSFRCDARHCGRLSLIKQIFKKNVKKQQLGIHYIGMICTSSTGELASSAR